MYHYEVLDDDDDLEPYVHMQRVNTRACEEPGHTKRDPIPYTTEET